MKQLRNYINIRKKPSTTKTTDENIRDIVKDALDKLGHDADLNHIDVSEVTNMNSLFSCANEDLGKTYSDLNPDISKWDVGNVKDMQYIFYMCKFFNCDISGWNVSNVENMHCMFGACKKFNQDISMWDVGSVNDMGGMFYECETFNQDISAWNTDKVKYHPGMYYNCPIKEEFKPKFK